MYTQTHTQMFTHAHLFTPIHMYTHTHTLIYTEKYLTRLLPAGRGEGVSIIVTSAMRKGTASGIFSYNAPRVSMLTPSNAPTRAARLLTVYFVCILMPRFLMHLLSEIRSLSLSLGLPLAPSLSLACSRCLALPLPHTPTFSCSLSLMCAISLSHLNEELFPAGGE